MSVSDWLSDLPFSDLTKTAEQLTFSDDIENMRSMVQCTKEKSVREISIRTWAVIAGQLQWQVQPPEHDLQDFECCFTFTPSASTAIYFPKG